MTSELILDQETFLSTSQNPDLSRRQDKFVPEGQNLSQMGQNCPVIFRSEIGASEYQIGSLRQALSKHR